jgi:hypothetical protein
MYTHDQFYLECRLRYMMLLVVVVDVIMGHEAWSTQLVLPPKNCVHKIRKMIDSSESITK